MFKNDLNRANTQRYDNIAVRSQRRTTNIQLFSIFVVTLMSQRQNYIFSPSLTQRWIVSLTHGVL